MFKLESGTVRENCTYIRNAAFPSSVDATAGATTYTVEKCATVGLCSNMIFSVVPNFFMLNQGVCFIRLDFETFTLAGPAATGEENGGLCTDTFTATVR